MKTLPIFIVLLLQGLFFQVLSQPFSPSDSSALLAIDARCDASNRFNWNTDPDPGNWKGVHWNSENPRRVIGLFLADPGLRDTLDVTPFDRLDSLDCSDSYISELYITGLDSLSFLNISYAINLRKIDLTGLINLALLDCDWTNISSLDISNLTNLTDLGCNYSQLTDLNASGLTNLQNIYCSFGKLESLNVTGLENLSELFCNENNISSLDLSTCSNLTTLVAYKNLMTSLDVSNLTKLEYIDCSQNNLTSLALQNLTNLKNVHCSNNQLHSLDITSLNKLEVLDFGNNLISTIDFASDTNLTNLDCSFNNLSMLDLSKLHKLDQLYADHNSISSLNFGSDSNLTYLDCSYNKLSFLDISKLNKLNSIYCQYNVLSVMDFSNHPALHDITCRKNRLPFSSLVTGKGISGLYFYKPQDTIFETKIYNSDTTIDYSAEALIDGTATNFIFFKEGIAVDTNTTGLYTTKGFASYYCQMTNNEIPGLTLITALISIEAKPSNIYNPSDSMALLAIDARWDNTDQLNWNTEPDPSKWYGVTWDSVVPKRVIKLDLSSRLQIDSLDASKLTHLDSLYCYNNFLKNLKLSGLTNLSFLACFNNNLSCLDLSSLPNLKVLICGQNQLTGLNVSSNNKLNILECFENQVTTLDLSTLVDLTVLNCSDNRLNALNLSGLTKLTQLYCYNNHLTDLNVSSLNKLVELVLNQNQITSLSISNLTQLNFLSCNHNLLNNIILSGLTKLKDFDCSFNHIDTLDLSGLTEMTYLDCHNNKLVNLNVSDQSNLWYFDCSYNQLSNLDASGLTEMDSLWMICNDNKLPFTSLATGLNIVPGFGILIFNYAPQDTIFKPVSITGNTTIDYSDEALIDGTATNFIFYKNSVQAESNTTGKFTTTGNGRYYCNMTNSKFPGLTLITSNVTISGVSGINDIETSGNLFYPNPATNRIYFNSPGEISDVNLFSLNGQKIIQSKSVTTGLDVSGLVRGIYIIQVNFRGSLQMQKVVIQ
jgi:Leucine-rich repeat (LRR) protein